MAYNRNQKHSSNRGPGGQLPIKHNQNKPLNAGRYGKVWNTIRFEHDWGRSSDGDAVTPVIGKIFIGGKTHELTFSETNKIIDTLRDAQHAHNVGVRMGSTNENAGHKDFMADAV